MFWFSRERRDPCFGHCVASALLSERSDPKIGWSGAERSGAERSGERALQKNDGGSGARSGGSRSGKWNGAGSGGYRIRLERGAAFSPDPLRSHALVAVTKRQHFIIQVELEMLCDLRCIIEECKLHHTV